MRSLVIICPPLNAQFREILIGYHYCVYPPSNRHALHVDVRQGGVDLVRLARPGVPMTVLQTGQLVQAPVGYSSIRIV